MVFPVTEAWNNQKAFLNIHRKEKNALLEHCFFFDIIQAPGDISILRAQLSDMANDFWYFANHTVEFLVDDFYCNNSILAVNHLRWQEIIKVFKLLSTVWNAFIKRMYFKIKLRTFYPRIPTTAAPFTLNHLGIAKNSLAGTTQPVDCSRFSYVCLSYI